MHSFPHLRLPFGVVQSGPYEVLSNGAQSCYDLPMNCQAKFKTGLSLSLTWGKLDLSLGSIRSVKFGLTELVYTFTLSL